MGCGARSSSYRHGRACPYGMHRSRKRSAAAVAHRHGPACPHKRQDRDDCCYPVMAGAGPASTPHMGFLLSSGYFMAVSPLGANNVRLNRHGGACSGWWGALKPGATRPACAARGLRALHQPEILVRAVGRGRVHAVDASCGGSVSILCRIVRGQALAHAVASTPRILISGRRAKRRTLIPGARGIGLASETILATAACCSHGCGLVPWTPGG